MILYKDTSNVGRTVSVGTGSWFYDSNYGSSIAAKNAAEADAYSRLLQQYPNATNIAVSSGNYFVDHGNGYGDSYGWCASATGTIPAKAAEKDTSSEERCVSVGNGGKFYYGSYAQSNGYTPWYNSSDAAKNAAEADARQRLLRQYPNATSVAVSSDDYFDGFNSGSYGHWCASATGTIPAKAAEKDNTEKVTTGYGVVTDCVKRAKETAKKKLKKNYPGVKNITTKCERTPEGGFVAKADGVVEKQTKTNIKNGEKMKTAKVKVGQNEWFHTYRYGSSMSAALAAEKDAMDRLSRTYPYAKNITPRSFKIGSYPEDIWVATAEGEIPVGTTLLGNENNVNHISIPLNVWFKNMTDAHTYIGLFLQQSFGNKLVSYKATFTTKLDKPVCEPGMQIPFLSQLQLNSANNLSTRIECVLEVDYI